jgi:hypothetical protein
MLAFVKVLSTMLVLVIVKLKASLLAVTESISIARARLIFV